ADGASGARHGGVRTRRIAGARLRARGHGPGQRRAVRGDGARDHRAGAVAPLSPARRGCAGRRDCSGSPHRCLGPGGAAGVRRHSLLALAFAFLSLACGRAHAQQFNSDSYLSKAHGMATIILTYGDRNDIFMNTFSLLPRWEFTAAVYVYNTDDDPKTDDGYSTSLYAKYMFYENKAKTGGFAVKAGTGMDPGYLVTVGLQD